MKTLRLAALVCLGLGFAPDCARAGFTQIVSFGDSLSDTGNVYLASNGTSPPAGYFAGHYSNGPIWVEYLAAKLGIQGPAPSLLGGTDYAFGGAETGLTGLSTLGTPNVGTQVSTFLAAGKTLNANQLVAVWGGANDFLHAGVTDPSVVINNLGAEITTLALDGGKSFVVPNLPLLGELPATAGLPSASRTQLDLLTQAFNTGLSAELNHLQATLGITVYPVDVNGLVQAARTNPKAYGFTNTTQDVVDTLGVNGNATGYLFWDNVHPTTAGQRLIADAAFAAVVPEPSAVVLLVIAGVCLAVPRARAYRRGVEAGGASGR